ncbi:MAG: class IV adenylate cyclase [Anaerolineaceae bacterium]|nr:class IV adenylate cyclase [Anaerolineaceae bacterium]
MQNNHLEIEVKFYVGQLSKLEERLQAMGARLVQPRTHELNLRFDTLKGKLRAKHQVLRLRRDQKTWLTFKGPSAPGAAIALRQEIEFEVSSFEDAKLFLESLGYKTYIIYEKYRQVFDTGEVLVMLDELPYGHFVEIEGADAGVLERAASRLGLNWEARSTASYLELFHRVKTKYDLKAENLCFDEFKGAVFTVNDLKIAQAD